MGEGFYELEKREFLRKKAIDLRKAVWQSTRERTRYTGVSFKSLFYSNDNFQRGPERLKQDGQDHKATYCFTFSHGAERCKIHETQFWKKKKILVYSKPPFLSCFKPPVRCFNGQKNENPTQ